MIRTPATVEAWRNKRHFYKPLPKEFRRDGFQYRQIVREKNGAIYQQIWNGCPNSSIAYEVVRVRLRKGFRIGGRIVQPAEVYPRSEAWGTDAFSYTNKDAAFAKLHELA